MESLDSPQGYGNMSTFFNVPQQINTHFDAHQKWLNILNLAEIAVAKDLDFLITSSKGLCLKERNLPPEILGRAYAQYCNLINNMYDAYLNSVHLQRAPYIMDIINVLMKRMYEIRTELIYYIVNDYIYVDTALTQLQLTPYDIQIVVPYHFPQEARPDSMEQLLQTMWTDAVDRKNAPPGGVQSMTDQTDVFENERSQHVLNKRISEEEPKPERFIQVNLIQTYERYRQWFRIDYEKKCKHRKMYFAENVVEAPETLKFHAAMLVQRVYRRFMELKRIARQNVQRDILLGIIPDPFKKRLSLFEENNKVYARRFELRKITREIYRREMDRQHDRLLIFKENNDIDDITDEVRQWFREWYHGYGFLPQYPYDVEGGTIVVVTGEYPTIQEQKDEDARILALTKGKTKEQIQQEKKQAKYEALIKAEAAKIEAKKRALDAIKARCNPVSDPGYTLQASKCINEIIEALQNYRTCWSFIDVNSKDAIYGYMKSIITEDLMQDIHIECRKYVDKLMRLDLKLLVAAHQADYKFAGLTYPKISPRKKPKKPYIPKLMKVDENVLKNMEEVFDLGIMSKPTAKLQDVWGDLNYAAAEMNVRDPDVVYPPPGYGDVKSRILLSCIFASGVAPGANRNKSVMLLGPPRNGKTFLADCVAGELNAVKIDISPEVFSAVCSPTRVMSQVLAAAKVFQPAVIFLKNIERIFARKVPPEEEYLNAKSMKMPLTKLLKNILPSDKIIFIGTCSLPLSAPGMPVTSLFSEILLVPPADYASIQMFFYNKLQSIRSMPRDYCVQPLAQLMRGYTTGVIMEVYQDVITAERIISLNKTPLSPLEFLEAIVEKGFEPLTQEEYETYVNYNLTNSPLKTVREDFNTINIHRADAYKKLNKKQAKTNKEEK